MKINKLCIAINFVKSRHDFFPHYYTKLKHLIKLKIFFFFKLFQKQSSSNSRNLLVNCRKHETRITELKAQNILFNTPNKLIKKYNYLHIVT